MVFVNSRFIYDFFFLVGITKSKRFPEDSTMLSRKWDVVVLEQKISSFLRGIVIFSLPAHTCDVVGSAETLVTYFPSGIRYARWWVIIPKSGVDGGLNNIILRTPKQKGRIFLGKGREMRKQEICVFFREVICSINIGLMHTTTAANFLLGNARPR